MVRRALEDSPQVVTWRGEDVIVVVRVEGFDRLNRGEEGLKDLLLRASDLKAPKIRRDKNTMREVEFG